MVGGTNNKKLKSPNVVVFKNPKGRNFFFVLDVKTNNVKQFNQAERSASGCF
jgi:hypothetical protein